MGLLTKLGRTVIKAADKAKDINKQMSLDLPDVVKDTPIKMPTIIDDLTDEATEMLGNKEAIDNWKKENKVPKKESKRRKQRKFSEQAQDLQAGIMSGPEYRKYIRENQPATSFTPEDLKTMMPNFKQVVGALTKDKSDSGILGLNSSLEKGNVVSSRLDIPAYNEHDIWVTSIVDKEKGKLYGRTAVLKNVNFDMTNKGAKKLALDIATEAKKTKKVLDKETGERVPQEFTQTKTPFATMKGEWQDFSDKDAFALAEKYINDPEWIQVGFNPERHSFFYDKETMMPVFNADAVVQIGALVLAKVPKLTTSALKAERINKLRKLRIDNMPEGAKPATFKEGGLVPMENQMNFALGGLNDEGGEIDEVSGNRVPIGGTKEGVRDDIPANVSEGEFVFPADVVRYHGLDKMMALRQEAKMGLRKMESMGQMGNSEEATMSDDMPFDMADLIVVGGQGEPMEFAEGGFVPQRETLQTAAVPTMGGGTTGGTTTTPIVYDNFMKTPVVTMKEYRDANGNSIIITSVNGKATTEIPAGYTLYTPPTNTAPSGVQAVIQTANNYSYQTSGGGGGSEGPDTPRELQVDPDYASMDNDTYFSTMERQNSFGGKAGNAAAMGIALAMGPLGLLTIGMLQADKKRQLTSAEQRIASEINPTKKKAYQATFTNMGGKTKEPEEENALVEFGKGFLTAVGGLFGFGNDEVETVARTAASAAARNTNVVSTAPERSLRPQLRPTTTTAPKRSLRPQLRPVEQSGASDQVTTDYEGISLNQSDAIQTRYQAQIALDKLEQKRLNEQSVVQPLPANQIMSVNPVSPTGNTGSVSQGGPMVAGDVVPSPITKPEVITTKTARPKPGENLYRSAAPTTLPPADALPLLEVPPIAQPRPTPAGIGTTTIASPRFPEATEEDISAMLQRLPAGKIEPSAAMSFNTESNAPQPLNIESKVELAKKYSLTWDGVNQKWEYPTPDGTKNMPLDKHLLESLYIVKHPNFAYNKEIAKIDSKQTSKPVIASPAPAPAIEKQTDAAFGPQTEYGRRIAESMANTAGKPVVGTEVAGLGEYIPEWLKRSATERVTPTIDQGAIQAQAILQEQALKDSPDMFGPEISPYATIPRANPVGDPLGANAQAAAVTETGISREPRGVTFVTPKNSRQVLANEADNANIAKNTAGSGYDAMATASIPPAGLEDPAITKPAVPFTRQVEGMGSPLSPVPDPRDDLAIDTATGKFSGEISDSQLNLGRARNITGPTSVGNYATAQTNSVFPDFESDLDDGTVNVFRTDYANDLDGPTTPTSTIVSDEAALVAQENARLKAKPYSKRTKPSTVKRTSKGTRKAARTGDDRLSQANFLERALGIEPAKVGARRGNDGVLYRTQGDKREADNRQDQAKATKRGSDRAKVRAAEGQAGVDKFNKANAADIGKRYGGDKEDGSDGPKSIVCTEMYRQTQLVDWQHTMKIWHVYQEKHLTPYHQVGYHWLFKPYVRGMKNSSILTKLGAALAKHRTEHLRYILTKGKAKDNLIGNVWCKFVHPLVYIAGIVKEKIGK